MTVWPHRLIATVQGFNDLGNLAQTLHSDKFRLSRVLETHCAR
jgi:hypothetical protein